MVDASPLKVVMLPQCAYLSEVSRALRIAQALEQRAATVVFASRGGTYAHLIEDAGYELHRLDPASTTQSEQRFLQAILSMGPRTSKDFFTDDELRTAVDSEVAFLREVGADVVVTGFTLSAYLSTKILGIPLATDHAGSYVPPVLAHSLCPAAVNPPDPRIAKLPSPVQKWMANRVPPLLRGPVKQLNRHARERGVGTLPGMLGLMCGDLTMVTELPAVLGLSTEALHEWTPRPPFRVPDGTTFRFTGPLFAHLDLPIPEDVDAFLDGPDPVVYVCPTSVTQAYLRSLVDGARAAGTKVLVGAGPHDVHDLADDRVLVAGVLPNHRVMPRVAAAVIMGGQGSVQTAIASGTPFVGLPYHGEQELNIAVAQRLGMAIRMKPEDAPTPALAGALHQLTTTPSYSESARRAAVHYEGVDGAATAADVMLEWLRGPRQQQARAA
jgi:UDP:flavonoid glycosyltransferase YjiC (YdhE family)